MPARIDRGRDRSHRQDTDSDNRAASAVAIIWLVFYVVAVGAVTWFLTSGAIEVAAR